MSQTANNGLFHAQLRVHAKYIDFLNIGKKLDGDNVAAEPYASIAVAWKCLSIKTPKIVRKSAESLKK